MNEPLRCGGIGWTTDERGNTVDCFGCPDCQHIRESAAGLKVLMEERIAAYRRGRMTQQYPATLDEAFSAPTRCWTVIYGTRCDQYAFHAGACGVRGISLSTIEAQKVTTLAGSRRAAAAPVDPTVEEFTYKVVEPRFVANVLGSTGPPLTEGLLRKAIDDFNRGLRTHAEVDAALGGGAPPNLEAAAAFKMLMERDTAPTGNRFVSSVVQPRDPTVEDFERALDMASPRPCGHPIRYALKPPRQCHYADTRPEAFADAEAVVANYGEAECSLPPGHDCPHEALLLDGRLYLARNDKINPLRKLQADLLASSPTLWPLVASHDWLCTSIDEMTGIQCREKSGHAGRHVSPAGTFAWGGVLDDLRESARRESEERSTLRYTPRPVRADHGFSKLDIALPFHDTDKSVEAILSGPSLDQRIADCRRELVGTPYRGPFR